MGMYFVKNWYCKPLKDDAIYGAEWAGTSDPSWVRTDAAVGFSDPNPYYSGMSTTPSSPFDNIMPWSGMRRVTDASAGELVEIPKFYYKWTRNGSAMKLQISMSAFSGSHVSPAHADRGDGIGERDYVYVGRYHCSTNNYKSASGVNPKAVITRATARNAIHNLGSNIWQFDFALWWTISMLYLVEYAHWDSQAKIGYGCGNGSTLENNGASDTMPYHTGTMKSRRTAYGVGIQYRYIEDLWAGVCDWVDGIYFSGANVYCIKNPASFYDTGNGTLTGQRATTSNWIKAYNIPSASSFEYALYPNTVDALSGDTYVCDYCNYASNGKLSFGGPFNNQAKYYGLLYMRGDLTQTYFDVGCRLMVLPSSRLAA